MQNKHDTTNSRKEQVEQLMQEPMPIAVTDYEERIRRNLLIASAISVCFTYFKLIPAKDSTLLGGFKFENLTPDTIYFLLLLFVLYEFVHYLWLVANKLMYWRIRLTGTNPGEVRDNQGAMSDSHNDPYDYKGKQENSNFYIWLIENKPQLLAHSELN